MEINQNIIHLSSVHIDENAISEKDRYKTVLSIPKDQILKARLEYGVYSERPIIQCIISMSLIVMGLISGFPIVHFILEDDMAGTSIYSCKPFAYGIPLILIGLWFFADIFKRRYYLLIETAEKNRKIVFKSAITSSELYNFIELSQRKFGYEIESEFGPKY